VILLQKGQKALTLCAENSLARRQERDMKREWDIEELITHFTLTKSEMALLDNKTNHT